MKNKIVKIFILIFTLFLGILIFVAKPEFNVYQAEVLGKIIDENSNPISGAKIYRIEEKINSHKVYGYEVRNSYKSDSAFSNHNGEFIFKRKRKLSITWHLKFKNECIVKFEVEKQGFKSNEAEWIIKNGNSLCNDIVFTPKITLQKTK